MNTGTCKIIASCFALAAFAVALMAGLAAGNEAAQILLRAVVALIVCYPVGLIAGIVLDVVIAHHLRVQSQAASAKAAHAEGVTQRAEAGAPADAPAAEEVVTV